MIRRPSITSRLVTMLYPEGVPVAHVPGLPKLMVLLDACAEFAASGQPVNLPVWMMAGDACPFEATGASELDEPIAFLPTPAPDRTPAPKSSGRPRGACAGVDWDAQPLGKIPDAALATRLGVSSRAVCQARGKRAIASFRPSDHQAPMVPPTTSVSSVTPPKPSPVMQSTPEGERERRLIEEHIRTKGMTRHVTAYVEPDSIPANPRGGGR